MPAMTARQQYKCAALASTAWDNWAPKTGATAPPIDDQCHERYEQVAHAIGIMADEMVAEDAGHQSRIDAREARALKLVEGARKHTDAE